MSATPAEIILSQLGGYGRLNAMIGAKDFMHGKESDGRPYLCFKFAGCKTANYAKIALDPDDTYTVTIGKIVKYELKNAKESAMVYADQLRPLFERTTGMYLSL